ncbi:T9SS type A sorting domain-containing protein [bacterium]|nr:T9SS type A sorting domain-containing protein [bacterium]
MKKMENMKPVIFFCVLLQGFILYGQRISVNGTEFRVDDGRIWLNGTNTPWHAWNDFGGSFNYDWWNDEFRQLSDMHINCTRVWITCDGSNGGINISSDGYVNGVNPVFWTHVDQLMEIAESNEVYVMIALISFDHTKPGNPNASKWTAMYNSGENRQSFVDNYAGPFVNRYKDNPYFFAVDVGNELEWAWENHGIAWGNVMDLIARVVDGVKAGSDVLVCQGWGAGIKYNTSARGGSGNFLANIDVDFYNIHYYDWQDQWFGNPFDHSPAYYSMNTKPCIVGEAPATGSAGYSAQQCYQKVFEQGWQGLMVWTSNGVDGNGDKMDSKPGTDWIYDNYPDLVEGTATAVAVHTGPGYALYQNFPNPFNASTAIRFACPHADEVQIRIYNACGDLIRILATGHFSAGEHSCVWNSEDDTGQPVTTGVYFCKMKVGDRIETKKMMIIK